MLAEWLHAWWCRHWRLLVKLRELLRLLSRDVKICTVRVPQSIRRGNAGCVRM